MACTHYKVVNRTGGLTNVLKIMVMATEVPALVTTAFSQYAE